VARSVSVSPVFPLPVWIVTAVPLAGVIVMDDVGRVAVELVSKLEYQAPVLAMLLTTTVWEPATVPEAAVAVTSLLAEDVTVRSDKGPVRLFSDCISGCRLHGGKSCCLAGEGRLVSLPCPLWRTVRIDSSRDSRSNINSCRAFIVHRGQNAADIICLRGGCCSRT